MRFGSFHADKVDTIVLELAFQTKYFVAQVTL